MVDSSDTHRAIVPDTLGLTAAGLLLTEGRVVVELRLAGTRFDTRVSAPAHAVPARPASREAARVGAVRS
ncbi:hypothetical protein FK267_05265 [Actinomyces oris]|uniref:Uncharacterized protein n=1 Tax=Actinomyces oris TaxID=544580 RepID=A0A508BGC3_9ACTO|nr:hypothetical protein FK267_05265 [Actinomyces oris]